MINHYISHDLRGLKQNSGLLITTCRYVILPKDFEKGYRTNVKKGDHEFAFYQ